jgi:large subunit ribosomal protein L15
MLNDLVKIKKKKKLIGRGGGHGGTSGRGHKGQKARSGGGVKRQFEGGQTPLVRRMPKRGFNNSLFASKKPAILTLSDLDKIACSSDSKSITKSLLVKFGKINNEKNKVKVLANGALSCQQLTIEVDFCSKVALKKIESMNGKVIFLSRDGSTASNI